MNERHDDAPADDDVHGGPGALRKPDDRHDQPGQDGDVAMTVDGIAGRGDARRRSGETPR